MPMSLFKAASLLVLLLSGGAAVENDAPIQLAQPVHYDQGFYLNLCPVSSCLTRYKWQEREKYPLMSKCGSYKDYVTRIDSEIKRAHELISHTTKKIEKLNFKKTRVEELGNFGLVPCAEQSSSK